MLPPDFTPPGIYPCDDGSEVTVPLSVMEWFMNHYDEAAEGAGTRPFAPHPMLQLLPGTSLTIHQLAARLWRRFARLER
jgi:hypothetical protein